MDKRTEQDLKRLKEIDKERWNLYLEAKDIKDKCQCYDYEAKIEETLAFEVTPKGICPVCGIENWTLSLEEKIECLKKYLNFGDDEDCFYTEEQITDYAIKGGMNYPRPDFYKKEVPNAPIEKD